MECDSNSHSILPVRAPSTVWFPRHRTSFLLVYLEFGVEDGGQSPCVPLWPSLYMVRVWKVLVSLSYNENCVIKNFPFFNPLSHTHICFSDLFFFSFLYHLLFFSVFLHFFFFFTLLTEFRLCRSSWLAAKHNKGTCTEVTWDLAWWKLHQTHAPSQSTHWNDIKACLYPVQHWSGSSHCHHWTITSSHSSHLHLFFVCIRNRTDFSHFTQMRHAKTKPLH